jgi:hypothetical protein
LEIEKTLSLNKLTQKGGLMDIKAYVYIDSHEGVLCFQCAVKEIIATEASEIPQYLLTETYYDLALETGDTGSGNDMRTAPRCIKCNKAIEDHYIA